MPGMTPIVQLHASEIFLTRFDHDKDTPDHVANIDRSTEIQEISRKLKAHEGTFVELAAKFSEDDGSKRRGGDMGWFSRERLPKEFVEKVFALPVGQVSEPFESHLGYHIVLVQQKRPARPAEFAEMKDQIGAQLDSNWREEELKQLRQKLRREAKIEFFDTRLAMLSPE
jgi:peptidyl-prolyl cis-trans isomerase C